MTARRAEALGTASTDEVACCHHLASIFRALGNPTRLGILRRAIDGPLCVAELQAQLGCSQPNISQHLAVLRDRGVVVPEREGNRVCYRLADERITELLALAERTFGPARPTPVD